MNERKCLLGKPNEARDLSSRLHKPERYLSFQARAWGNRQAFRDWLETVRRVTDKLARTANVSEVKRGRDTIYLIAKADFNLLQFTSILLAALILTLEPILLGAINCDLRFAAAGKYLIDKVQAKMPPTVERNLAALSEITGTAIAPNRDDPNFRDDIEKLTSPSEKRVTSWAMEVSQVQNEIRLLDLYSICLAPRRAAIIWHAVDRARKSYKDYQVTVLLRSRQMTIH